ncbi:MAG TPA: hypothetical protein VNW06_03665 [Cytophagaceae bacterium]|jgi:hypothetical protein|nr:hypothetical protein [Cytophagaceae bacterium]
MNIQLTKCLEIQIMHSYFAKSICDVLTFVPMNNTRLLMKNYSLRCQQFSNQFSLYCGMNADLVSSLPKELIDSDKLFFKILSSDIHFINYTDLVYPNPEETLYFFSNEMNRADSSALQQAQYVSASDQLLYKPFVFSFSLPAEKNIILIIKKDDGQELIHQNIDGTLINSYIINLKPYGEGRYTLWINNEREASYFVSGEDKLENCLGVLQLNVSSILYAIGKPPLQILHLRFNTRSTYWKYSIVLAADRQITIKDMHIEATEKTTYNGPEIATIVSGEAANVFISKELIPLQQENSSNQLLKISYSNNFSERLNEMDIKMPSPDISNLSVKKNDANELSFFSSKIIYI